MPVFAKRSESKAQRKNHRLDALQKAIDVIDDEPAQKVADGAAARGLRVIFNQRDQYDLATFLDLERKHAMAVFITPTGTRNCGWVLANGKLKEGNVWAAANAAWLIDRELSDG